MEGKIYSPVGNLAEWVKQLAIKKTKPFQCSLRF